MWCDIWLNFQYLGGTRISGLPSDILYIWDELSSLTVLWEANISLTIYSLAFSICAICLETNYNDSGAVNQQIYFSFTYMFSCYIKWINYLHKKFYKHHINYCYRIKLLTYAFRDPFIRLFKSVWITDIISDLFPDKIWRHEIRSKDFDAFTGNSCKNPLRQPEHWTDF